MVADTGSTNGTFIGNQRIPYGKAFMVNNGEKIKFGTIEVVIENIESNNDVETVLEDNGYEKNDSQKDVSGVIDLKQIRPEVKLELAGTNETETNQK